jgi:hypothetical protein
MGDGACNILFCAAKRSGASFVTFRRFHEAVFRVIVTPSWGPALCHDGRNRLPAVLARPQSSLVVVCTV